MTGRRGRLQGGPGGWTRRGLILAGAMGALGALWSSRSFNSTSYSKRTPPPGADRLPAYLPPTEEFFSFTNGPPPDERAIDSLRLRIGSNEDSIEVDWAEVVSLADRRVMRTLQCDGNGYEAERPPVDCGLGFAGGPRRETGFPPPKNWLGRYGGIGNAEWDVVPVRVLFEKLGAQRQGNWLHVRGRDDYFRFFPSEIVDNPNFLLAVGMNGKPLPHDHGAPGRLLVPDQYGAMNIKWLEELTYGPMDDTRFWDEGSPNHYPIKPIAWAVSPLDGAELEAGYIELTGISFAGGQSVKEVSLFIDEETSWNAEFLDPPEPLVWRRWKARIELPPGQHILQVACIDALGRQSKEQSPYGDAEGFGGLHKIQLNLS